MSICVPATSHVPSSQIDFLASSQDEPSQWPEPCSKNANGPYSLQIRGHFEVCHAMLSPLILLYSLFGDIHIFV